jgi:L-lactate dehydrogenase
LRCGAPLCPKTTVVDGDYEDFANSELVMIITGINEKAGGAIERSDPKGRLRLFDTNAEIYCDIVPRIVQAAPRAVILVVTDPPDPLADTARTSAGHDRVLSTGTFLDSLRRCQPGGGASNRGTWRVAGLSLVGRPHCRRADRQAHQGARLIEDSVRYENITIIEGNDASQFGIGIVAARITEMVLRDERAVVPIGSFNKTFASPCRFRAWSDAEASSGVRAADVREERQALEAGAANLRKSENRTGVIDHHDLRLPVAAHRQRWSTQGLGCSPRSCARDG